MAKVTIDGVTYDLDPSQNLLAAALAAGLDIPYFCWHPALGSVGACRQCAVKQYKDANDTRGMLQMACTVPVTEGARFSLSDPDVVEFRETITEWLMTNHPHDCPVCDEGGECHLQDMTVMTGHNYRRYRFTKRTFQNQNLGPHINHEMNRCITCYRCVRFYNDYAGGHDLQAMASHNHVYFGRHEDGTLENEFSGNLVEVCPTGVFTDKTYKQHFVRKWDLETAPSICHGCGLGCNIIPGQRFGQLKRILNRFHGDLNGYFLCDRGRFGSEYVTGSERFSIPAAREPAAPAGAFTDLDEAGLAAALAPLLAEGRRLTGIGSPRASLEGNFALRSLVGPDRFSPGLTRRESALLDALRVLRAAHPARIPSLREIEQSDAVLVLGEDLTNTAPRMALSVRQAVRNEPLAACTALRIPAWSDRAVSYVVQENKGPLYSATPAATRLDDVARATAHGPAETLALLGYAIAHAIDPSAPAVAGLTADEQTFVTAAARDLRAAKKPVVLTGLTLGSVELLHAAANVSLALHRAGLPAPLAAVVPEANTIGTHLLGGPSLEDALADPALDVLVILENDLYQRLPAPLVDAALDRARAVVVIDLLATRTAARAHLRLPAAAFAEGDGTLVNYEGRAQRFFQVYVPGGAIQEGWRWVRDLLEAGHRPLSAEWDNLDDVLATLESAVPALRGVAQAAPLAEFKALGGKIPRLSRRASGRTAEKAHLEVSEDPPPADPDSPLSFSMEGAAVTPPAALLARYWAPGWNSVSSLNKFQDEVGGHLRGGDPGVRLLDPAPGAAPAPASAPWQNHVPAPFVPAAPGGALRLLPLPHIFGSEELSARSPGIRERSPGPFLALHPDDAAAFRLAQGDLARLTLEGRALALPVRFVPSLARGTAGLPVGLPGLAGLVLPATAGLETA